jgi:nitrogen fixation NifU-like protein
MNSPDAADLYQDIVMRHSRTPKHKRDLAHYDVQSEGNNPLCGDRVAVRVCFDPDGHIADCAYDARGCAISLASSDLMAEAVRGMGREDIVDLNSHVQAMLRSGDIAEIDDAHGDLRALSGVAAYKSRIKCASLPWAALIAALEGKNTATSEGVF